MMPIVHEFIDFLLQREPQLPRLKQPSGLEELCGVTAHAVEGVVPSAAYWPSVELPQVSVCIICDQSVV